MVVMVMFWCRTNRIFHQILKRVKREHSCWSIGIKVINWLQTPFYNKHFSPGLDCKLLSQSGSSPPQDGCAGRPRVLEDRHLSKAAMGQPLLVKVSPQWHGDPLCWRRKEVWLLLWSLSWLLPCGRVAAWQCWDACSTAKCRAVIPVLRFVSSRSLPLAKSKSSTSIRPPSTAKCNAVLPVGSVSSTTLPIASSISQTFKWPCSAAISKGVM